MNDEGVYRTAPVTPGLLAIQYHPQTVKIQKGSFNLLCVLILHHIYCLIVKFRFFVSNEYKQGLELKLTLQHREY